MGWEGKDGKGSSDVGVRPTGGYAYSKAVFG
jgi:hypothetical protein